MTDTPPPQLGSNASATLHTRERLSHTVRDSLPSLALACGLFYAFLAPAQLWFVDERARFVLAGCALASAFACLALGARWRRKVPCPERAHLLLAILIGVALTNAVLHMALDPAPHQTTNFALIAVGIGFMCLSHGWLAVLLALNLACWATVAWVAPPAESWTHFSFFLLVSNAVAVAFHLFRVSSLRGLELSNFESQGAQVALRRSEAHLRAAQRLARFGSYEVDTYTGETTWSEDACRILGVDPSSRPLDVKEFLERFVHPDDRDRAEQAAERARRGGEGDALVYRVVRPDGSIRYVETCGSSAYIRGGRPKWIGTLHNATDRELGDQALRLQQEEVNHAARLGTMGELAAALAHELRQPLAAIVNYARGCSRRLESGADVDTPALQDALNEICTQAERSSEILRALWSFARKGEPKREWVNLDQVSQDVLHLVDFEARRHDVKVRLDPRSSHAWVYADSIQTHQVLLNLVRNGFDAIREGSGPVRELSIQTKPIEDGMVGIAVQDTGRGLQREIRDQLYEPFTTTKPTGLGLGLSISRRIVESYGGRIWATPNPAGGTTFHFTLPGRWEETRDGA